jgi:hypothetical protein
MGILPRLQVLTSRAVLSVAERLASRLREIKVRERQVAATNSLKAATQRRIIKPEAEGRAVGSLVHWLYAQGALVYDNADHLYVHFPVPRSELCFLQVDRTIADHFIKVRHVHARS